MMNAFYSFGDVYYFKEKMKMNKLNLNEEQQQEICYIIDQWYLNWKNRMTEYPHAHCLGMAKEQLKSILCEENK